MKKIYYILLLINIFYNTITPSKPNLTPQNTEINFDIDEVLIEQKNYILYPKIIFTGIWQDPLNAISYISALISLKDPYIEDEYGNKRMYDQDGNKINSLTFQFLYHGIRDPRLTPYIANIIKTVEGSRQYIPGTIKICKYLKYNKGYTINFATNKDHLSYELTAQNFGDEFTKIPTKVFLAHPGNSQTFLNQIKEFADQSTTPADYKELAYQSLMAKPTDKIFHAPSAKPDLAYFQYMEKIINGNKNLIFIDDQKANVEGFNELQQNTNALRYGIHFKNPIQLADELIKLGILSPSEDKQLLDNIGYPRIMRIYKYTQAMA
jgi:FMN phosphatase YigB (HAD superfamily)